jgi:hypothetical protein
MTLLKAIIRVIVDLNTGWSEPLDLELKNEKMLSEYKFVVVRESFF